MKMKTPLFIVLIILLIIVFGSIFYNIRKTENQVSMPGNENNINISDLETNNEKDPKIEDEIENSKDNSESDDEAEDLPKEIENSLVENEEKDEEGENDALEDTTYENEDEKLIVKNVDDILVLVNKKRNLPSDYIPQDLTIPNVRFPFTEDNPKKNLRKEAAEALEKLFDQAEKDDIILYAVSGYRSYNRQKTLFDNQSNKVGPEAANLVVAYPGQSEHQTGLAMDVSSQSANFSLEEYFEDTLEGKWLKDNAHRAGFIIRFKKGATDITGYSYEPWHIRYVGEDVAKEIYERDIVLEEYLGDIEDWD